METSVQKMDTIRECVMHKDPIGVKKLILEDKFNDESYFWELISLLGSCCNEEVYETSPGFVDTCERCMKYIVNVGNPKELVIALLEQSDNLNDTVKFQVLLNLIQRAILRIPKKQLYSLELALETFSFCFKQCELPSSPESDEESRASELDPQAEKIIQELKAYLDFLSTFVDQVDIPEDVKESCMSDNKDILKQREVLQTYLLEVLGRPMAYFDLTVHERPGGLKVETDARICADKVLALLLKLDASVYNIIDRCFEHNKKVKVRQGSEKKDVECVSDLEMVSPLSIGCLLYMSWVEKVADPKLPSLVSRQGALEMYLPSIQSMICSSNREIQIKGVSLFSVLLSNIEGAPLPLCREDLDRKEYFEILGSLFEIMIHCAIKSFRQTCVKLVPVLVSLFDFEGRYQIFMKLFGTLKHSGAQSFCVQLLKKQIEEILQDQWTGCKSASTFTHLRLKRIMLLISSLPEGAATDLVEHSDRIIAVLNLVRYLVLKDPPEQNMVGFWDFYPVIEKDFLKALHLGLDMSKGHYKMEIEGLAKGNESELDSNENVEMSVSVAGFRMPNMPRGQKIAIMEQALNTLELVTSLLVRVDELVEQQQKNGKTM